MLKTNHIPVLTDEVINYLHVQKNAVYIDTTLGGGGHASEIIRNGGFVLGIDQDKEALKIAKKRLESTCLLTNRPVDEAFKISYGNFRNLELIAIDQGVESAEGILFDLGVSSMQLDSETRGFSFRPGSILDMRMDPATQSLTAADLLNTLRVDQLIQLLEVAFPKYQAQKIALAIDKSRKRNPLRTSHDLVMATVGILPRKTKPLKDPSTKLFMALRIAVNSELESLAQALPQALNLLKPGGRLVVISFHSGEDRVVKNFIKSHLNQVKVLTKKPIKPSIHELENNKRSRSAKLRAIEKNA